MGLYLDDMKMMSVQCNIILNNGYMCGLPPIGRCATCQRAFCASHQAWGNAVVYWSDGTFNPGGPYVDMCAPCFAMKKAEDDKRREEARAPYHYFESGAARTALLTSGVQPVKIYEVEKRVKKGFLFTREVNNVTLLQSWILGEFEWKYSVPVARGTEDVKKKWLTALLDLSPDDQRLRYHSGHNSTLARVQLYRGGYELVLGWLDRFEGNWEYGHGWREAMQAVKRLTGESS